MDCASLPSAHLEAAEVGEGVETLSQIHKLFKVVESVAVVVRAVQPHAQAERVEGGHPPQDLGQLPLSDRIATTSFCILPLLPLNPRWLTLHPSTFTSESPMAYAASFHFYV